MNTVTWLAPLSSWLVMLHLGAQVTVVRDTVQPSALGFYGAHYAAPLAVIFLLQYSGLITLQEGLGLAICVLAGVGTSAVPLALRDGAAAAAISRRLSQAALVALFALPLSAFFYAGQDQALRRLALTAALMAGVMWLPWQLGRLAARRGCVSAALRAGLGRLASLSVLALILLVAWQHVPRLPEHPSLLMACVMLVAVLGAGGVLLDASTGMATTAVVRNLTLATVVLSLEGGGQSGLTALAAFGVMMYLAVWPTSRLSRGLRARRLAGMESRPR